MQPHKVVNLFRIIASLILVIAGVALNAKVNDPWYWIGIFLIVVFFGEVIAFFVKDTMHIAYGGKLPPISEKSTQRSLFAMLHIALSLAVFLIWYKQFF